MQDAVWMVLMAVASTDGHCLASGSSLWMQLGRGLLGTM